VRYLEGRAIKTRREGEEERGDEEDDVFEDDGFRKNNRGGGGDCVEVLEKHTIEDNDAGGPGLREEFEKT
jgi:hypothetical protein